MMLKPTVKLNSPKQLIRLFWTNRFMDVKPFPEKKILVFIIELLSS